MASDAWTMSTHEFRLLWEDGPPGTPYPQTFATGSGETYPDGDARRLAEKTLLEKARSRWSPVKTTAFEAFHGPTLSVDLIGATVESGKRRHFRAHGAYRGPADTAFLAVQSSTDNLTIGGPVSITVHPLKQWSQALVATMPPAVAAGTRPTDTHVPVTHQHVADITVIPTPDLTASRTTAAAAFVHELGTTGAVLTLRVGSLADGTQPTSLQLHVADLPDDGRYALVLDSPATALGVDDIGLARLINKTLNALRKRHHSKGQIA